MRKRQFRALGIAAGSILLVWLLAWAGYAISNSSRMTGEKIKQYIRSVDFAKLSAEQRRRALMELAAKLNSLSLEDRRRARWQEDWKPWFEQMTDEEKEMFIQATLPNDIKQMIDSFEKLPADKRKKTIDNAMKNLRESHDDSTQNGTDTNSPAGPGAGTGTNANIVMDPALVQKAETLGLKTFYNESSPETKAELAPLLEEIQHQMQNGRPFH